MQISRRSEYAIHSMMILAFHAGQEMSVDELAMMQEISRTYLAKVMQKLANAGLVQSSKGFNGGYWLAIRPEELTLREIVTVFEEEENFFDCLDQERNCQLRPRCVIHRTFSKAYTVMMAELDKIRLADLLVSFTQKDSEHSRPSANASR